MGDQNQLLKDFAAPNAQGTQSSITRPNVEANNFELKPSLLSMIFPFSLRDKARAWLHSLPAGSITTWDQLSRAFLAKYFPPSKTSQMRNQITIFVQKEGESLYEAWERYKELLRMCPHHGLEKWLINHTFYNGLTYNTRMTVDAAAGGALMNKTIDEAYTLIEDMAQNHYQWANERAPQTSKGGKYEIDALDHISSKVDALFKKVESLRNPPSIDTSGNEQVNYVNNFNQKGDPFSNTYNPGWRNHPNFSYRNPPGNPMPASNFGPPGFRAPQSNFPSQKSNLENMMEKFVTTQSKLNEEFKQQQQTTNEVVKQLASKMDSLATHNKMLETQISLLYPFPKAISQMPYYAKFLKEILSNKRKLEEYEIVALTEECSAIIQNKLPPKLKDPGSFSIPCVIGNVSINRALCDLGASVSLMPMSIYKKLGIGDLKPTTISLQLADRSVKYPVGILEDVPIQVGKFFFPVDFVILEMEEDSNIPIILGRPFLATAGAIIDVKNGSLTLNIGGEKVEFDLSNTMKLPLTIDKSTHEQLANHYSPDPLEKCLVSDDSINDEDPEVVVYAQSLESTSTAPFRNAKFESLKLKPKGSTCEEDKAPIGMTPFKLVYDKSCHLPVELEHKAYWAIKLLNFDMKTAGEERKLQRHELDELRLDSYENARIYKERTKRWYDKNILRRDFNQGDMVLLFNSRLKLFPGKLKSRWSGPFQIREVFPSGVVEV
ncbi:uncharacterized protein LOC109846180 [Asparagus officinalis]|uniref:uncharacterized protein LOC109846180 n=1 Tax=Asparagus officinalis TaxID=4686 RepID=UPI00098E5A7B|nr:uncharacterized protein LOC109846180 [Asparagus officinalis]